ncbi:unnamed protein product [Adineta ricciae]|nr:unnamed protein product [Adineta ricciae]
MLDQTLVSLTPPASSVKASHVLNESFYTRRDRMETFTNWPHTKPSADDMASNGWFSCRIADRVICIYCDTICHRWKSTDDPKQVHKRLSPQCTFVLSELSESSNTIPVVIQTSEETFRPHHTDMCQMSYRLKSFDQPAWTQNTPTAHDLAYAGFFYSGEGNVVTCFYCNGSLKQWNSNDSPKVEHARWFPHCLYAKHLCGDVFYNQIQLAKHQYERKNNTIDENELTSFLKARLDLPIVRRLSAKYSLKIIERCYEVQYKLNHNDFRSDSELEMNCFLLQKQLDIIRGDKQKLITPSDSRKSVPVDTTCHTKPQQCRICFEEERQLACLPCGHFCACTCCGYGLQTCPVCRTTIQSFVRLYC